MSIRSIVLPIAVSLALVPVVLVSAQTVGDSATAGQAERPATADSGAQVYRQVCQACHMADGRGASGVGKFPGLAGNPRLRFAAYPITMVVRGKGGMPSFADLLTPEQIAAVVGHIRTHFGNDYVDPVTAAQVSELSKQLSNEE